MAQMTLSPENEFSFRCPIFNVDTKMSSCMKLRDLVWRGADVPVRKGCQACMQSSKCPAAAIISKMTYAKEPQDFYGSTAPKLGKLRPDILNRILRVIVQEPHLNNNAVPPVERSLIASANDRIRKMLGVAAAEGPDESAPPRRAYAVRPAPKKAASEEHATPEKDITEAARTGDLGAAIS